MYLNHDNQEAVKVARTARMKVRNWGKSRAMALVVGDLTPSADRAVRLMVDALHGGDLIHTAFLTRALTVFLAAESELERRLPGRYGVQRGCSSGVEFGGATAGVIQAGGAKSEMR